MGTRDRIIASAVPAGAGEQRLDIYLSSRFNYLSRTSWQKEIVQGRVLVNGSPVSVPGRRIRPGDMVAYIAGEYKEPDIDPGYSVIFEDEQFLAVSKSGNIPVHPAGIFFNNTLIMLLENDFGVKLFPVHRLDRETSGAILFGKSAEAASMMQKNFGSFAKSYRAVVRGVPVRKEFTVDVPIGQARESLIRKKREAYPGAAEESCTRFRLISASDSSALVEAVPVTGRMHQIRVHLKYAGHPIIGDKLYGEDERVYLDYVENGLTDSVVERAGFIRCALHSYSIGFVHPYKGTDVSIIAPLPDDMKRLIDERGLGPE